MLGSGVDLYQAALRIEKENALLQAIEKNLQRRNRHHAFITHRFYRSA
jgi:hypothetical protein